MKRKQSPRKPDKSQEHSSIALTTERAIFLQGEIDEELFRVLTPQILRLKEDNSRRITVFIDSRGGSPKLAGRILALLRSVNDNGQRPRIVTVATGEACSAAADLLSQGDYVMAFRHANLHFHGTRTTDSELTRKDAEDRAKLGQMTGKMTLDQFDRDKMAKTQFDAAVRRAYRKAEPLWRYVSTLCRKLNEGENEINPEDAWHLGLVDEVIGLPLAHRTLESHQTDSMQQSLSLADTAKFMA